MTADAKRARVAASQAEAPQAKGSRIFSPFRVLGNVSNEVPHAIGTLGTSFYIVTAVGQTFQIYDAATLHLLFVSETQTPLKILCVAAHFKWVYAGYGNQVGIYHRGRREGLITCPDDDGAVHKIMVFGDFMVVTTSSNRIHVFKGKKTEYSHYTTLVVNELEGLIVDVIHPPTYLNKIVVATTLRLIIFNIKTGRRLFALTELAEPISAVECAPVLDLVAIGGAKGGIQLFHLKKGVVVGPRINSGTARVALVSFRTDGLPHLVAALADGRLFFYDLARRAKVHVLEDAHSEGHGGVAAARFLNGQPIVVSNGGDNQLKEWAFDPPVSKTNSLVVLPPRHLRLRGGHLAPPVAIEFPDEHKTHFMLLALRDHSVWMFSLRKDAQAQEMSQRGPAQKAKKRVAGAAKGYRQKFLEVVAMALLTVRAGEWDNMLTAHLDEPFARAWDTTSKRVGGLQLPTVDGGAARAVCISQCGNFGVVGLSKGAIASYNMQLGNMRRKYLLHKAAVTGLAIDGFNRKMVSCGLDGVVGFYDFADSKYLGKLQLDAPITGMVYQHLSDLVAFSLDDLLIVVVDAVSQKVVRVLWGHTNRITGLDFSPDGRWVVLASLDATLRTWDLPTGGCIDGIRLPTVATLVKFSPLGDVLATTHVSGNGIFLWTNRAQFRPVAVRLVEEEDFATSLLPSAAGDGGTTILDGALDDAETSEDAGQYVLKAQIDDLVTLFPGARSKFQTLIHFDTIKQQSKPKEAPKKPENAPFFLQLTGEQVGDRASVAENAVAGSKPTEDALQEPSLRVLAIKGEHSFESKFTGLLRTGDEAGDFFEFIDYVVAAAPPVIDVEIRALNSQPPLDEMQWFVRALTQAMASHRNFDMIEAMMHLFLRVHGDVVYHHHDELNEVLTEYRDASNATQAKAEELVKFCDGVISFLQSI